MISLHRLEIFAAVVQDGSFSATAERLYLTQSAVSQHIQTLENGLGTQLFKRGRRGVTLTPSGEILWGYAQNILRLLAEAESAVADVEQLAGGQVHLGATPGVGIYLVPNWIQSFQRRFPKLSVSLVTDVTEQIANAVLGHTLEIGFIEGDCEENSRLTQLALEEVEQFVIVGRGHPWCHEESIPFEGICEQPFIIRSRNSQTRLWLDNLLAQHGFTLNVVAEFDNPEAIKQAVMAGMGISIMPAYIIQREESLRMLRALPVQNVALQRTLRIVWNKDQVFTPITRAFLSHLATQYPQLLSML